MEEFTSMEKQGDMQVDEATSSNLDADNVRKVLMKKRIEKMPGKKKLAWILGVLILIITGGYGLYNYLGSSNDTSYLTMKVGQGMLTDSIEATGTLSSVKESAMGFKKDEIITALNVQPGDHVKKGQVLATQDATTLNSTLQQAIRSVEQDEISIKTSNLALKNNMKTLEQQQSLFDAGVISESELDTAKDNVSKSEWEIATAKSKQLNDQSKVEQAQSDLDDATLVAPFDGIIGAVNGQVGQINGINSNSSTLLTVMSEDLELSALVNEADIGKIKVGQNVEFTSSSYSDQVFKGKVLRITPQAQTVSNVQYYPVLISCVDPDHKLFSGMSVSANIIIARKSNVLTVPMMAVSYAQSNAKSNPAKAGQDASPSTRTGSNNQKSSSDRNQNSTQQKARNTTKSTAQDSTQQKQSQVMVLQNNQAMAKAVILGLSDGSNYEVVEGLKLGEQVIVGSNQVDTSTDSSSSGSNSNNSRSNNNNNRNQSGGMGGPPPGF
ncbi:MAG: efflux RND transporter periplasmic adaptor subunit [Syntrophomonas sp.]